MSLDNLQYSNFQEFKKTLEIVRLIYQFVKPILSPFPYPLEKVFRRFQRIFKSNVRPKWVNKQAL